MSVTVRDRHNQRRRALEANAARAQAYGTYDPATKRWFKPDMLRCTARNAKGGHKCRLDIGHKGNHRAFGADWK